MAETITIRGAGITLELLLHRRYGVRGRELVEAALRANPGLPLLGLELPLGTTVDIPDLPPRRHLRRQVGTLFG